MNRFNDVLIIGLLVAFIYLLATREDNVGASVEPGASVVAIAVLPYVVMNEDPSVQELSDSLWGSTISSLAKYPELRLAARTSSAKFKGTRDDIRTIGRDLEVSLVIEGAVRMSGNSVRMTAQLIRVEDGTHVWSETYDGDSEFADGLPDLIAASVVEQINNIL